LCKTPAGLRVYQRVGSDERMWFALNYTEQALSFTPPGTWVDVLSGETCAGEVQVGPLDLRILASETANG
jgi:beta-galactosidase GanA